MPRLADVVAAIESLYDPRLAAPWDAVGLVCGDPEADVSKVLFAVDPVTAVVDEAVGWGADLLVTHHPLFLTPVNGFPATDAKGRLVHRLVREGTALYTAHTNADSADPGVSDALAKAIGLTDLQPLAAHGSDPEDKIVTYVPPGNVDALLDALAQAGAGQIGAYERCAWTTPGQGTFRPLEGAHPLIGQVGKTEHVVETRIEMVLPRSRRTAVVAVLRAAHPYDEPAFDVYELASIPASTGTGRVGVLPTAEPLAQFVHRVAAALPPTVVGVRAAGDPERPVQHVAVCGGAGDSLIGVAKAAAVDAYVTADLKHHRTSEALESGAPALVDATHWATEWPWLSEAAKRLEQALLDFGTTVETRVSQTPTDPWTIHVPSRSPS